MQRSHFLAAAALFTAAPALAARSDSPIDPIEKATGGKLGVFAIDTGSGKTMAHRSKERFPMCSTFKALLAAQVLKEADSGRISLGDRLSYGQSDILSYAPVTKANLARGSMTIEALCAAAVEMSDNTAANLLLTKAGGPQAYTMFAESLGDAVTKLDHNEPAMSDARYGDFHDTTSPRAMANDLHEVLLGNTLSAQSRAMLEGWMRNCKTGDTLLRAGMPKGWIAADKTGSGTPMNRYGDSVTRNDIGIFRKPGRAPVIIAAYLTDAQVPAKQRDAALAAVAHVVLTTFA